LFRRDRHRWSVHMSLEAFVFGWACFIIGGSAVQILMAYRLFRGGGK
jgi:hypothetical protein